MPPEGPLEVVGCRTGAARYPDVADRVRAAGGSWALVDCFDRCEVCERGLLVRVDGVLMRMGSVDELVEAVTVLSAG